LRVLTHCARCGLYKVCDNKTGVWICRPCAEKAPKSASWKRRQRRRRLLAARPAI
jgi:ribosomal protein L37AE/L43A